MVGRCMSNRYANYDDIITDFSGHGTVHEYHWYRAVAIYVTTVNRLYISLLILGYLRYLPRLCGKKSGRLYNELRNKSSLELKLLC